MTSNSWDVLAQASGSASASLARPAFTWAWCVTNDAVDAAYVAAITAGGTDEGEPSDRTYFAPGYYAANVAGFDGNHLEFVHKAWNPAL